MRSLAPSARLRLAIAASLSTRRRTSRSRRICSGATSRSTRWRRPPTARSSTRGAVSATSPRRCSGMCRRRSSRIRSAILRLARFAARFAEFRVAPETEALMRSMVDGRRSRRAGARARLEGTVARPARAAPVADVRGAARLRRARPDPAGGGPPVGRAATAGAPPGGGHRRAPDDGARCRGATCRPRSKCATPACATTWARARRRPRCCRSTSATSSGASSSPARWARA